jgi:hypothetical protein
MPPSPVAARRALDALAAAATIVVVLELFRLGTPLGPLRKPVLYVPAIVGALAVAARAWLARGPRSGAVVAGALSLAVFLANGRGIVSGDTFPANYLPWSVLRHGTLTLDPLALAEPLPYWAIRHGGHVWSRYPIAAPLLALPVYLPAALGPAPDAQRGEPEKLAAALMCAISAGLVLAALRRAGAPAWLAAAATAIYATASPVLTTASQALWQHAPSVLALSAAIWASVRARAGERSFAAWAGLACGVAVAARPTDAIVAAALALALAPLGRRSLLAFAAAGAAPLLATAAYQAVAFGVPWATGYGDEVRAFGTPLGEGLLGVLASPTRGLLTFAPWAAAALAGLCAGARRDALHRALLAACVTTILLYARWHTWWGGWCFGPRMLCDLSPLLAFGLGGLGRVRARLLAPALAATGLYAAALGALAIHAPRSPLARAVYEADGRDLAMEWRRYPPIAQVVGER